MKILKSFVGLLILAAAGFAAYVYFSGGSGQPSTQLTTPSLGTDPRVSSGNNFVIVPDESIASFQIDEVLFGQNKTVIGSTSQVAGQLTIDVENPQATQISDIIINARTFQTDKANRDRAIRSAVVLGSGRDEFEFITFTPTSIEGLSNPIEVGKDINFKVNGDLTVKGTTKAVTFDVTGVLESADRLRGRADSQVLRSDFGIGIPNAPGVGDVSEQVTISLDFVADKG